MLHSISEYAISPSHVMMFAPEKETIYSSETHKSNTNTNTKLDFSETSFDCPNKMGEGGNGSSHCPLPKVLVRSEKESLKLNINQEKTMTFEHPITLLT